MVKKSLKKSAFSMAEVLVVLAIVGIMVVLMLTLMKPDNSILKLQYYKAYNVLSIAAYNSYNKAIDNNTTMYENEDLCRELVYYINNSENNNCKGTFVDLNGNNFTEANTQFIASNSMIFYLSRSFALNDFGKSQKHRVVWVDINGERHPNSAVWSQKRPADIVAFDITDTGDVVPLGYPKVDTRYLMAKMVYSGETNKVMADTFYKIQKNAFGNKQYEYEPMSYNFDQSSTLFNGSVLKIDEKLKTENNASQDADCVNDGTEDFPKCSLDILK